MFEQTFVAPATPGSNAGPLTASLLLQCAAVLTAILISVVSTQGLPQTELKTRLIAPPPPLPPPTARAVKTITESQHSLAFRPHFTTELPIHLPGKQVPLDRLSTTGPAPVIGGDGTSGSDSLMSVFGSAGTRAIPPAPPVHTQPKPDKTGPQRVSEGVAAGNLIQKVLPHYPQLAVAARIQGTVRFHAVIGEDGRIRDLAIASGPPLLIEAAREAVLAWRYRPTLLNGKPVPVLTDITVNFKLGDTAP